MAEIRIPTVLRPSTGGKSTFEVEGETVKDVLSKMGKEYPGFLSQILNEQGEVVRFVNIYVNDDDIRYLEKLETKVGPNDKIAVLPAVAGGQI